jgi:hypothetical protein
MTVNNYTGPYWSDGKLQSSVEFGKTPPGSALDAESRLHDSAYAHFDDVYHRIAADYIYNEHVENLGFKEALIGSAVMIGNQVVRAGANIGEQFLNYGPLGLIVGAVEDAYATADYAINHDKYEQEVKDYYATDPGYLGQQGKSVEIDIERKGGGDAPKVKSLMPGATRLNPTNTSSVPQAPALLVYDPYSTDQFYRGRRLKKKHRRN